MPFPIKFKPMRAAVVDLDPELSVAETRTVIGLIPSIAPPLFLFDIKDAPMYIARREFEVFRKRRKTNCRGSDMTAQGDDIPRTASGQDLYGLGPGLALCLWPGLARPLTS